MSSKILVVGNWKMNPATLAEARRIARKTRSVAAGLIHTETVVCPPFAFIAPCAPRNKTIGFSIGAQTVSVHDGGAHTGEVSAAMLKDVGVEYVIVGHSESRESGDTDEAVSKRARAVLAADLRPIVCVGEKARDGDGSHFDFLEEQIKKSFVDVPKKDAHRIIMAYEPVWAIGAKESMKPEDVNEMSIFVRKVFSDIFGGDSTKKTAVLYGGSVNFRNAAEIIRIGRVDGLLVGRESVNMPGFGELLKAVDQVGDY